MASNGKYGNPLIKVTNRKISRNKLKRVQDNNKIQKAWRRAQIKLYGFKGYIALRVFKTPQPQRRETLFQVRNGG
jgi:hypothetical protein